MDEQEKPVEWRRENYQFQFFAAMSDSDQQQHDSSESDRGRNSLAYVSSSSEEEASQQTDFEQQALSLDESLNILQREARRILLKSEEQLAKGVKLSAATRFCLESFNRLRVVKKFVRQTSNGAYMYFNSNDNPIYLKQYQILQCLGKCPLGTDPDKVCLKGITNPITDNVCVPPSRKRENKIQRILHGSNL